MKTGGLISAATPGKRRLLSNTHGSMTIPGIIFFTLIMAVSGLAIDMQRVFSVHGEMQSFVDNVALASAAELNRQTGAIGRAFKAACGTNCDTTTGLVSGTQKFADGAATLRVQKLTFLSQLDNDPGPLGTTPTALEESSGWVLCTYDAGTWTPANCEIDPATSRNSDFVEVVAAPRNVSYVVLPIADVIGQLVGAGPIASQATLRLRATAGYRVSVCDLSPLMICNPLELDTNTNKNLPFAATVGQQIIVRAGSENVDKGGQWTPGDFGWLDVNNDAALAGCIESGKGKGGGSGHNTGCVLGLVDPLLQCFDNNQIVVDPGQTTPTADGLNVRFDIYPQNNKLGNVDKVSENANFAPSVNVTRGVCDVDGSGKACDYAKKGPTCPQNSQLELTSGLSTADRSIKMPRDQTWDANNRFGKGDWNRTEYWQKNHGWTGSTPPTVAANWTRYQTYRNEIECSMGSLACVSTSSPRGDGIPNEASGERASRVGTPPSSNSASCSTQPGVNDPARDRRMLYVAVVNCKAWDLKGGSSSKLGVTAVNYIKMFLTEPVGFDETGAWKGTGSTKNVYAEVIDVLDPNDEDNIVRVYPVLYR